MKTFKNQATGVVTSISFSMSEITTLFDLKYGAPQICTELKSVDVDEQSLKDAIDFAHKAENLAKSIIKALETETEEDV